MIEKKVWGTVEHLHVNKNILFSFLKLKAGFRCSKHLHVRRNNLFIVNSGTILVELFSSQPHGEILSTVPLTAGGRFIVASGIKHRFRVIESGSVTEAYWTDDGSPVLHEDIVRDDIGGKDDLTEREIAEWMNLATRL